MREILTIAKLIMFFLITVVMSRVGKIFFSFTLVVGFMNLNFSFFSYSVTSFDHFGLFSISVVYGHNESTSHSLKIFFGCSPVTDCTCELLWSPA